MKNDISSKKMTQIILERKNFGLSLKINVVKGVEMRILWPLAWVEMKILQFTRHPQMKGIKIAVIKRKFGGKALENPERRGFDGI